jgi:N-acetylglucosamine-6-phosphate deacetylase
MTQAHSLLLRNCFVVLPDTVLHDGAVFVQGQKIKTIFDADPRSVIDECEVLDLNNSSLFPGFIDIHIHGAGGVDTMTASSGELIEASRFLVTRGVTSWLPTLVPAGVEEYTSAICSIEQVMTGADSESARVLGTHYEGPFVNHAQCGALHREHFRSYKRPSDLDELPVLKSRNAKMMTTLAPEVDGGIELIQQLRDRGWIVSIGHTRAELEILDQAFTAGARHMTHFMNAMPQLHHRDPGPIGWGLSRDDVTCDIIADGIHLDRAMLKLLMKIKGSSALSLISDSIAAAGKGDGDFQIWGETISVKNGRTSNVHGSIAGSVITMLDAVRMMRSLGASDVDVAKMASSNPAKLLGIDDACGSIEEGKRADLVAIDAKGEVKLTIAGGEVAFRT